MADLIQKSVDRSDSYDSGYDTAGLKKTDSENEIEVIQRLFGEQYHIIKRLGKGAQGAVFLAEDSATHRKAAIKQLIVQSVKDWKQYDLFHREADTLKRLDISGVAKLIGVREFLDIPEPRAFIIQEYIEGEPLQQFIARGHRFQIGQIGDLMLQLLTIIEQLHKSDPPVIHRDIKPSNILLNYVENSDSPEVHLIDFGAVANPQVKSGGSTVVGTYGYMAPEQLMGHPEPASDIYSLAIVAVYLLSGVAPEDLEIQDFHVLIDPHLEHLPYRITGVLRKMLAPKADERLTDFETLRQFFMAIKEQRFEQIPQVGSDLAQNRAYALEQVKSFLQPGNIELWQALEEKTPRPLSRDIRKMIYRKCRTVEVSKMITHPDFWIVEVILLCASTLSAVGIMGAIKAVSNSITEEPSISPIMFVIAVVSMALFFLIIFSIYIFTWRNNKRIRKIIPFLETARKSMATVIRIEYVGIHSKRMDMGSSLGELAVPATWKITYSFNPPDDSSPDALIRTFHTHTAPDGIKEGCLIPILYLIKNDDKGEHVQSTPYPIPVSDDFMLDEGEVE